MKELEFSNNGIRNARNLDIYLEKELEQMGLNSNFTIEPKRYKSEEEMNKAFELLLMKIERHVKDDRGLLILQPWTNELQNIFDQSKSIRDNLINDEL